MYATVDRTVYKTEQLIVLPGEVVTEDWDNTAALFIQDLDDEALFQDFSRNNAAYVNRESPPAAEPSTDTAPENVPEPTGTEAGDSTERCSG